MQNELWQQRVGTGCSDREHRMHHEIESWQKIGTVVGNTSTDEFTFILTSLKAKLGDIIATSASIPDDDGKELAVIVWGRITGINRFNPFFPAEAAQELANSSIDALDTVLSTSRDHLEAKVLILGRTSVLKQKEYNISPLSYPVKPSAAVHFPPSEEIKSLLNSSTASLQKLHLGTLIGRSDVDVDLTAKQIVSRHMAILAMTGGGKTVAARRVIRELAEIKYPLVIFDPHGDYLGLYEKQETLGGVQVKLIYPKIVVSKKTRETVGNLISKMGANLTEAQAPLQNFLLSETELRGVQKIEEFLTDMIDSARALRAKIGNDKASIPSQLQDVRPASYGPVIRNLEKVKAQLETMAKNNERLRQKFSNFEFTSLPDPSEEPDEIVSKGQISIFYLAGFDHLTQSTIASIVLESLFNERANLTNKIPPFQVVLEEAHNFIPSRQEGAGGTPSLQTVRKLITEGRKFGTGLLIISQRPSRLDETILAQCNSFLVLRLVNPKDKSFIRSVMENLSETDANILQSFGLGQGIVSGQAVRFPLLIQVKFDEDLVSASIGDEDFINEIDNWQEPESASKRKKHKEKLQERVSTLSSSRKKKQKGGLRKLNY